ncbi:hypothetical protein SAY87_004956 [Trapa incisa]|uniref:Uncharacterized protein n=1 Tax=Trapa incisa TaxID=236973 RepID=A0AAN7PNL8_9MYRT|nr:hypothetical protein SAY87_004956 [Trapa incisa]
MIPLTNQHIAGRSLQPETFRFRAGQVRPCQREIARIDEGDGHPWLLRPRVRLERHTDSFGVRETRHFFSKKSECSNAAAAPPDGSGYWKFLGKQPCHRYKKPIQVGQNKLKAHFPFECIGERRWQSLS